MKSFFVCIALLGQFAASAFTVNVRVEKSVLSYPVIQHALTDFRQLLTAATRDSVYQNGISSASVVIDLPHVEPVAAAVWHDTAWVYASRSYKWSGTTKENAYHLRLEAANPYALSAALYGLLQDILGFSFYHPRELIIPALSTWPLTDGFAYESSPRFEVTGFHLHTQHPIEMTEALMDENYPNGEQQIEEYINWLVRNRQNYFEFCLLESIRGKAWAAYAKKWVAYAHERGIMVGIDLSLHMIQQKAYQLYRFPFRSFRTKKNQIKRRVALLCQVPWDAWSVEFSTTEFSKGNKKKKEELQLFLLEELKKRKVKLMGRAHVVRDEAMLTHREQRGATFDSAQTAIDKQRSLLIHTVMFYSLNDTSAPVYGNKNLWHMRDLLRRTMTERETWYYPESAYWITFDNSVPLFLPSYLTARLSDILYCDTLNVKGHLTFSSGWEWGYWLFDWSIANWCWKSVRQHREVLPDPLQFVRKLVPDTTYIRYFGQQLRLHEDYVKGQNLIRYMDAQTVTDEMPGRFNLPLHPRPSWRYKWLARKARWEQLDSIAAEAKQLADLYYRFDFLDVDLARNSSYGSRITKEFNDGFAIDKFRAIHRYNTLSYIIDRRRSKLQRRDCTTCDAWLQAAAQARASAQQIVERREAAYRYPLADIALRHRSHTAYAFGYLYPVHELHFWKREEQQSVKNKWGPLFQNIWNIARIIGIID